MWFIHLRDPRGPDQLQLRHSGWHSCRGMPGVSLELSLVQFLHVFALNSAGLP